MALKNFRVTVDGQTFNVVVEEIQQGKDVPRVPVPEIKEIKFPAPEPAKPLPAASPKAEPKTVSAKSGETVIPAPMPGAIIDVKVSEGDTVMEGDVLLILEAMKMENDIVSPVPGKVIRVMVKKGDTVNSGDTLVLIG